MAKQYALHARAASQREKDRADQVKNNSGGYVFSVSDKSLLERFLIIGSETPTFYQTARELTRQNAQQIEKLWADNPDLVIEVLTSIVNERRAPKVSPALFVLALGTLAADVKTRKRVYALIPTIVKNASQLFEFVSYVRGLGKGWGRGLLTAIKAFYKRKDIAYQVIKYRNRSGFTHKDMVVVSHAHVPANVFKWLKKDPLTVREFDSLPPKILEFEAVQADYKQLEKYPELPWEAVPTEALNDPWTWKVLLPGMPETALIRNLAKMTAVGVLKPLSKEEGIVIDKLSKLKTIHPVNILVAQKVYASGRGLRGSLTWLPNQNIVAALETAFYNAFQHVQPAGKRYMIGLDVSGSMSQNRLDTVATGFTAREAAGAMAMSILRTEPRTYLHGFSTSFVDLNITKGDTLSQMTEKVRHLPFARTNVAVPMLHATQHELEVDTFVILTDNEANYGNVHPYQALKDYRKASGIDAGLVVAAMTPTPFTVADPRDHKSLDIVGFDAAMPKLISMF